MTPIFQEVLFGLFIFFGLRQGGDDFLCQKLLEVEILIAAVYSGWFRRSLILVAFFCGDDRFRKSEFAAALFLPSRCSCQVDIICQFYVHSSPGRVLRKHRDL